MLGRTTTWLAALAWAAGACGSGAVTRATPAVQAAARPAPAAPVTPFVSPYSYEWFVRAELLAARGEHAAATQAYRRAMGAADDDPYLYARLSLVQARAGHLEAAQQSIDDALRLDPQSEAAWMAQGALAELRGDPAAALSAYERAEVAAPESPQPPQALSRLLYDGGQDARALAVLLRHAARSQRGLRPALQARLRRAVARHDHSELVALARQWLRHAPRERRVFLRAAAELRRAGDPAGALALLQQLPPEARGRMEADLLLSLGEFDALERRLLQTPPTQFGGPLGMSELLLDAGRAARALELLQETPPEQEPHRHAWLRGRALLALDEPGQAARWLVSVPEASAYRTRALHALQQALEAGGLREVAEEVAAHAAEPPPR